MSDHICASTIRILWMVSVYSSVSFLTILFPGYSAFFKVASDLYAAVAVASLFLLLSSFVEPTLHDIKAYCRHLEPAAWQNSFPLMIKWLAKYTSGPERGPFRTPRSGLTWFNVRFGSLTVLKYARLILTDHLLRRFSVQPRLVTHGLDHCNYSSSWSILRSFESPKLRSHMGRSKFFIRLESRYLANPT